MSDGALTTAGTAARQPLLRLASDTRLARLAAEGSAPAFSAIYERHHQAIYRYCRSILRSDEDARDALQNTMLKAMRALDGETREISLRPWLFRIAHNEAVSLVRRRPTEVPIELSAELAAADADLGARERLRDLITDLEQLTPRQKSSLVMRELNGLEFAEIGAALETSPQGAKQAVYEARQALHQLQEGREMDCGDVRKKLSEQDGRMLRGRHLRAHLKGCSECRAFKDSIGSRRGQLAMLAPPLPLPIALHLLDGILGGGGGSGGVATGVAGGGAAAGATGGAASGAAGLGAGALAKVGIAGALALGAGAATVEMGDSGSASPWERAEAVADEGEAFSRSSGGGELGAGKTRAGDRPGGAPGSARGGGDGSGSGSGSRGDDGSRGAQGTAAGGSASPTPSGAAGQAAPGQAPAGTAAGASPAAGGPPDASAAPVTDGGGPPPGAGPTGTPPGHGGTPPGQGGTPPGLGTAPPGQGGTPPGLSGTPPGQGAPPPGQSITPPGHGNPPAQGLAPPGQPVSPPLER